jgi:tetratricopeptide (TPR) repeat protein
MRIGLFAGVAVAGFVIGLAEPSRSADEQVIDALTLSMICGNEADSSGGSTPAVAEAPPTLRPGFGNGGFTISTGDAEAQRWFSHGVQLAQAFAHDDAKAAFKEAARRDPTCAMCVWGEAFAEGPTINYDISADERAKALTLAIKAQQLGSGATAKEKRLLAAMVRRYQRSGGDTAYAADMAAIARTWPDDDALQVLAAEALMDTGKTARVREADALLERGLVRTPDHVGAIHFYIHSSEWIGVGGKAEPYADRLGALAPAASHLIHMPSHTYYRVGRYREAGRVNLSAIAVDTQRMMADGATTGWKIPYYGHNVRFAVGGAMMAGDAEAALAIADLYAGVPVEMAEKQPWMQASAGSAWFALGRYGDPDRVLARAGPDDRLPLARAMWRYGRGEALARKGDAKGVLAEAAALTPTAKEMAAYRKGGSIVPALVLIAHETLLGRAAMLEGRYGDAAAAFRKAAAKQEKVFGFGGDPPIWWYPARRSLAAALLAGGKPDQALAEANAVLAKWPKDPMSLLVLSRAEAALGHQAAAADALLRAKAGWSGPAVDGVSLNGI